MNRRKDKPPEPPKLIDPWSEYQKARAAFEKNLVKEQYRQALAVLGRYAQLWSGKR